ncbi:MAG TPA: hypothetical protein IAC31_05960 [Candidatus Faecousia intestinigallinarum]|nr:hypothetical protein [Candidatus Faecousia intestinigallinarum]
MEPYIAVVLEKYGTAMELETGEGRQPLRAFLQLANGSGKGEAEQEMTPLGEAPGLRYCYLGPKTPAVAAGDILRVQGHAYQVRRAAPVYLGDEIAYYWGMCAARGEKA